MKLKVNGETYDVVSSRTLFTAIDLPNVVSLQRGGVKRTLVRDAATFRWTIADGFEDGKPATVEEA